MNTLLPYRDPTPGWVKAEDIVQMALDAARYRFIREHGCGNLLLTPEELDASVDARMADEKEQE